MLGEPTKCWWLPFGRTSIFGTLSRLQTESWEINWSPSFCLSIFGSNISVCTFCWRWRVGWIVSYPTGHFSDQRRLRKDTYSSLVPLLVFYRSLLVPYVWLYCISFRSDTLLFDSAQALRWNSLFRFPCQAKSLRIVLTPSCQSR